MKKRLLSVTVIICAFALVILYFNSLQNKQILDPKKPTVVTFWHSYNNFAKSVIDEMILDFNDTIGAEQGIVIDAYGYGEQQKLEEALYNSANKVMGAEKMPDIFISYPDNALRINEYAPLVDLTQYFSKEELTEYRKEFLEEGMFGKDQSPKMIPVAKSTELVLINTTDWKKFVSETNYSKGEDMEAVFSSWENIVEAAQLYFDWTDGKPMLGINLNNDIMYVTASQLGNPPFDITEDTVSFSYNKETAKKIWDTCYVPHINGWFESAFYNQDAVKSGHIVAYIGSSAGSGFFPSDVTIDADISYPIECTVVSYPAFDGTTPYMAQRGANIAIAKSDEAHEYAASEFIKWFTADHQSIQFAASTGYIPVKNKSLENKEKIYAIVSQGENKEALEKSVLATLKAVDTREFVIRKPFENSYDVNSVFRSSIFEKISADLDEKQRRVTAGESEQAVLDRLCSDENFDKWYSNFVKEVEACIR